MNIHSMREVILGAASGLGITVVVTLLFRWLS